MTYKLTVKPRDLAVKSPETLHAGPGATLDGILSSVLSDIEYELEVDIHELLAENREIALIWATDDVRYLRPDLDEDQAWHILQVVEKRLDSEHGIAWDTLEYIADELYPQPDAAGEEGVEP